MTLLLIEFYKLKRKKIFLMITLFLSIEMLWVVMSVSIYLSKNGNNSIWEHIITTVASMNGLFLPILCAIISSKLCDMETKGNTWRLLISSNVSQSKLYFSKYSCSVILLLFVTLFQTLFIILIGLAKGGSLSPFFIIILKSAVATLLTSAVILTLQQWITLVFKNQAFALCFGMLGGFIGLASVLFPTQIRLFFIWSYYIELCPIKMNFAYQSIEFIIDSFEPIVIMIAMIQALIFYAIGNLSFLRKEY